MVYETQWTQNNRVKASLIYCLIFTILIIILKLTKKFILIHQRMNCKKKHVAPDSILILKSLSKLIFNPKILVLRTLSNWNLPYILYFWFSNIISNKYSMMSILRTIKNYLGTREKCLYFTVRNYSNFSDPVRLTGTAPWHDCDRDMSETRPGYDQ